MAALCGPYGQLAQHECPHIPPSPDLPLLPPSRRNGSTGWTAAFCGPPAAGTSCLGGLPSLGAAATMSPADVCGVLTRRNGVTGWTAASCGRPAAGTCWLSTRSPPPARAPTSTPWLRTSSRATTSRRVPRTVFVSTMPVNPEIATTRFVSVSKWSRTCVADVISCHNKQVCARTCKSFALPVSCRRQAASQKQALRVGSIAFCVYQAESVPMKCIAHSDPNQS